MTVLNPPPLPIKVIPVEPTRLLPPPLPAPARPKPRASAGYHGLGVVMMFLFCCWIPIAAATMYQMWNSLIAGNGPFFSGHLMLMIGRVFILILALIVGVLNCQYANGGLAATIAFCCITGRTTRGGFWIMGPLYGLLSGLLLLDTANAMNGPAAKPLGFPIPRLMGAIAVPMLGIIIAVALRRSHPETRPAPAIAQ